MTTKNNRKKLIHAAPYILPISSPPIQNGAIFISDGRIEDIGDYDEMKGKYCNIQTHFLDSSILMPGLVNPHMHLEYSALGPLNEPVDFIDWITNIISKEKALSREKIVDSIKSGIHSLIGTGITSIGEVSRCGLSIVPLANSGLKGIIYNEIVAVDDTKIKMLFKEFITRFEICKDSLKSSLLSPGVFPHSVYTLSEKALKEVTALIKSADVLSGIHVSETKYEKEFIEKGTGPLADFIGRFCLDTVKRKDTWKSSVEYLDTIDMLNRKTHLVHLTHIDDADFSLIEKSGASIVTCPRSNYLLNNVTFPLNKSLDYDITIGLGTDSLASNYSFDMFEEMRLLKKFNPAEESVISERELNAKLLEMATINGAKILGMERETGTLSIGKCADIISVKVRECNIIGKDFSPIDHLVNTATADDVNCTIINGNVVYTSGFDILIDR